MDTVRKEQFAYLDAAWVGLLAWARVNEIPLVRIEFVVPFVDTDFSSSVWLFFDSDLDVTRGAADGTTARVEQEFLSILSAGGYPADWLSLTSFVVDSHENVERDFEGSYFCRLR